jgi:hypothetical protein
VREAKAENSSLTRLNTKASDVASYPARAVDTAEAWCYHGWANALVLTCKFKDGAYWQAIQAATAAAQEHGYSCRSKHFFNNKNECTLLVQRLWSNGPSYRRFDLKCEWKCLRFRGSIL